MFRSLLLVLLAYSSMWAQQSAPLTLDECVNYALTHQLWVENARLNRDLSRQKTAEISATRIPQIDVNAAYTFNIQRQWILVQDEVFYIGNRHVISPTAQLSMPLLDRRLATSVKANRIQEDIAEMQLRKTQNEVIRYVKQLFYSLLVTQEQEQLINQNCSRLEKALQDTQLQYDNGLAQKVDVSRIRVLLNNARTEQLTIVRKREMENKQLKFYMGYPMEETLEINGAINDNLLISTQPPATDSIAPRNVDYNIDRLNEEFYKKLVANARANYLPDLYFVSGIGLPMQSNDLNRVFDNIIPVSYVGIQLNFRLFEGLKRNRVLEQSRLQEQIASNNRKQSERQAETVYRNAYQAFLNDLDDLANQKANIELARFNYDNLKFQYDNGIRPSLEVINAEISLREAQTLYINALYNLLLRQVELDYILDNLKN